MSSWHFIRSFFPQRVSSFRPPSFLEQEIIKIYKWPLSVPEIRHNKADNRLSPHPIGKEYNVVIQYISLSILLYGGTIKFIKIHVNVLLMYTDQCERIRIRNTKSQTYSPKFLPQTIVQDQLFIEAKISDNWGISIAVIPTIPLLNQGKVLGYNLSPKGCL